jgi:hypothetical protein
MGDLIKTEIKTEVLYKTELCKKWEETGYCPYEKKCKYAHGEVELSVKIQKSNNYKKKKCVNFHEKGFCEYGSRCNFVHHKNHQRLDCFQKFSKGEKPLNVQELYDNYKYIFDYILL